MRPSSSRNLSLVNDITFAKQFAKNAANAAKPLKLWMLGAWTVRISFGMLRGNLRTLTA
jgi:hypothetical protein